MVKENSTGHMDGDGTENERAGELEMVKENSTGHMDGDGTENERAGEQERIPQDRWVGKGQGQQFSIHLTVLTSRAIRFSMV